MPDPGGTWSREFASGAHRVASPRDGAVCYSDDAGKKRVAAEGYVTARRLAGKEATKLEEVPCGAWIEATNLLDAKLPLSRNLVVSADTRVYFGDSGLVLGGAHAALRVGGWLGFSLEAAAGEGFDLAASGRYRHSREYAERCLLEAGFGDIRIAADSLRKKAGQPVASWVVLARRAAA